MVKSRKRAAVRKEGIGLKGNEELVSLDINKLVPNPKQPRKKFNEETIKDLAQSISSSKQLVPIIVSPLDDGRYLIVDGERRYKAAKKYLKLDAIPALVMPMSEREIKINSFSVNVHRDDLESEEKEDYIHELYEMLGTVREVGNAVGWAPQTIHNILRQYDDRKMLSARADNKIPEDTSSTVLRGTAVIKEPDKRAKFINMVSNKATLPWGLKLSLEPLTKAATIFEKSKPEVQDETLNYELSFDDAKRLTEKFDEIEEKEERTLTTEEINKAIQVFKDLKHEEEEKEKDDDEALEWSITGEEPQRPHTELQKAYTLTDKFYDLRKSLRGVVIAHDIAFKAEWDDPNATVKMQKMLMEVLSHVGAEFNTPEENRLKTLEEYGEYNAFVHKITGLMQPIIDTEIKNSKTIKLESLR